MHTAHAQPNIPEEYPTGNMESNYWQSPKNTKEGLGEHRTNLSNTCIELGTCKGMQRDLLTFKLLGKGKSTNYL